ncbi:hypothetical protein PTTG_28623 [Puccinia triticina 1-1 BBBD Race 1]|uniref:Uncharacterized protein n=1 Tax=Puccinia triticina (isolate 1-1 / race 1 (BBBD)) TaxID=630390 RepID=A0A180GAC9_PUCT1|nr:hypothetical protein PTTG_28623 [Puccinia triticina 1-1 BBBD Race 1]
MPQLAVDWKSHHSPTASRNQGLTNLNDQFDQVECLTPPRPSPSQGLTLCVCVEIEKEYEWSDMESEEGSEASNVTATPGQQVQADFEEIMDDFLGRLKVLGGKMKPVMAGNSPLDKLDTLRSELLGPAAQPDCHLEHRAVKEQILAKLKADQRAHDSRLALPSQAAIRIRDAIGAAERKPRDEAVGARVEPVCVQGLVAPQQEQITSQSLAPPTADEEAHVPAEIF